MGVICVKPDSQHRLWSDGSPSAVTGEEPFRCGRTRIPGETVLYGCGGSWKQLPILGWCNFDENLVR
jgi:hypothetical protein